MHARPSARVAQGRPRTPGAERSAAGASSSDTARHEQLEGFSNAFSLIQISITYAAGSGGSTKGARAAEWASPASTVVDPHHSVAAGILGVVEAAYSPGAVASAYPAGT